MAARPELSRRGDAPAVTPPILLLSRDRALREIVREATPAAATVSCTAASRAHGCLQRGPFAVVVIDDAAVESSERGWLLEQVRRCAAGAFLVYVAARQDAELERRVRASGVTYYTSRPLEAARLRRVLGALAERADALVVGTVAS